MAIPAKVRNKVLARDSFDGWPCCVYCGEPAPGLHLHHVIRRSQGGTDTVDNLVALCFGCHMALHDGDIKIEDFVKDYIRRKNSEALRDK